MMAAKERYHPARPLKARELATLGLAMASNMDERDTYMLGAAIFAILSRPRWSCLKFVDQFWWNVQITMSNLLFLWKHGQSSTRQQPALRRSRGGA